MPHSVIFLIILTLGGSYSMYDYSHGPYYVTIPAGWTSVPIYIRIFDDSRREKNEMFHVYVHANSLPYNIHSGVVDHATVTIMDNDGEWLRIRMYMNVF